MTDMTESEWSKLCKNIYEKRCVLFIGSEFPVELNREGVVSETTFSQLLSEKLEEIIKSFPPRGGKPFIYDSCTDKIELSQIATGYLKCFPDENPREDLELVIKNYLREVIPSLSAPLFRNLMELPFQFIVDTNFSNFFSNEIRFISNKNAQRGFYHFREPGSNVASVNSLSNAGTEARPFVYNLYGSIENTHSIALSENELIEWLTNVISGFSEIPKEIKSMLVNPDSCFLFVGFGFASKDWFFRILLHTLGSVNKKLTSYAMQTLNAASDSSVVFFKAGLKVGIYPYDNQNQFVKELIKKYQNYATNETDNTAKVNFMSDSPTAFISYKSENYAIVKKISDRLKQNDINTWLDKERLSDNWNDRILTGIDNTNTYLLMQSLELEKANMSYVNLEIHRARKKMQFYRNKGHYFFPCCISESPVDIFRGDAEMQELQRWNLVKDGNINTAEIDRLAGEIRKNFSSSDNEKGLAS